MSDIQYVIAGPEDVPSVVKLRMEFALELSGGQNNDDSPAFEEHLTAYFSRAIEDGTYICVLAKHGEDIAGVGGMSIRQQPGNTKNPTGIIGYIMNMYTSPQYRRKGISAVILHQLVAIGKENGISMFELHATKEGEYVYQKNGFQLHPEPTYRLYVQADK